MTMWSAVLARRCYYHADDAPPLMFAVPTTKRGPLKVAVAQNSSHLQVPNTFSRTPHGSMANSPFVGASPRVVREDIHSNIEYLAMPEWHTYQLL